MKLVLLLLAASCAFGQFTPGGALPQNTSGGGGGGAFVFTNVTTGACSASPCTTAAANMGSGSSNVFVGFASGGSISAVVITDSQANTWTTAGCQTANLSFFVCMAYCINCTASASQTFTATQGGGGSSIAFIVQGFSGASGASAYDSSFGLQQGVTGGGGTTTVSLTGTTSAAADLIVTGAIENGSGNTSTGPTCSGTCSWSTNTHLNFNASGNSSAFTAASYWIPGSSVTANAIWTGPGAGSYHAAQMIAIKH